MKITHFSSNYNGLSELFGLPAVGKTTFLETTKQYFNINDKNNKHPIKRHIFKILSFFYVLFFEFIFFKDAARFVVQSKLSFGDCLRLFLNLLRVKRESLKYSGQNMMSDQGFLQAVWSVSVFSSLDKDEMANVLLDFMKNNQNTFPRQVVALEENFNVILEHELKRYGKLGNYYANQSRQERAEYFQSIIIDTVRKYYTLVSEKERII